LKLAQPPADAISASPASEDRTLNDVQMSIEINAPVDGIS